MKLSSKHVIEHPEQERETMRQNKYLKRLRVKNFQIFRKASNIQEAQEIPSRINAKKTTPGFYHSQTAKNQMQRDNLESSKRKKRYITPRGKHFSPEMVGAGR